MPTADASCPPDVRASYRRFPGWTQHFWTWQTGKALPGQSPLIRHTWASYLATVLAVYAGGLTLSAVAVATRFPYWYLALLAGWVLTVNGARHLVLTIAHQALHRSFSRRPALDLLWGDVATVLSCFHTLQDFKEEHFDNHHRRTVFATEADPPVQFLRGLGFHPEMTKPALWRRAWTVFVSPAFYWNGFRDRMVSNLTRGGPVRRMAFGVWALSWLSLPLWLPHGGWVLLLAFVVPVIPFAQLSALLDRLGEHEWLAPRDSSDRRFYTVSVTSARFCGEAVPPAGLPRVRAVAAWLRWIARTALYHLPSRLLVVVGDLPNHDFHHRYPANAQWTVAAYARQHDIDTGPEGPAYREVWGMGAAIDNLFQSWQRDGLDALSRS